MYLILFKNFITNIRMLYTHCPLAILRSLNYAFLSAPLSIAPSRNKGVDCSFMIWTLPCWLMFTIFSYIHLYMYRYFNLDVGWGELLSAVKGNNMY